MRKLVVCGKFSLIMCRCISCGSGAIASAPVLTLLDTVHSMLQSTMDCMVHFLLRISSLVCFNISQSEQKHCLKLTKCEPMLALTPPCTLRLGGIASRSCLPVATGLSDTSKRICTCNCRRNPSNCKHSASLLETNP